MKKQVTMIEASNSSASITIRFGPVATFINGIKKLVGGVLSNNKGLIATVERAKKNDTEYKEPWYYYPDEQLKALVIKDINKMYSDEVSSYVFSNGFSMAIKWAPFIGFCAVVVSLYASNDRNPRPEALTDGIIASAISFIPIVFYGFTGPNPYITLGAAGLFLRKFAHYIEHRNACHVYQTIPICESCGVRH